MVSPAHWGWHVKQRKVLDHVLLLVFILLHQAVTSTITMSSTSTPLTTPSTEQSSLSSTSFTTTGTTFTSYSPVSSTPENTTESPLHLTPLPLTTTSSITVMNTTSTITPGPTLPWNLTTISATLANLSSTSPNPVSSPTTISTSYTSSQQLSTNDTKNQTNTATTSAETATTINITSLNPTSSHVTTGTTYETNTTTSSASTHGTTVGTPISCNFSQNCTDQSVYYWMMISVEVTGNVSNESDITDWLRSQFQQHLSKCSSTSNATSATPSQVPFTFTTLPTLSTLSTLPSELSNDTTTNSLATTSGNFTSVPSSQNGSSITATSGNSSIKENETTANLFQNIEVMCDNKTAIRSTVCTILLQLSQPTSPCCIAHTVSIVQNNSTIKGQVVGKQVERVAKGLCQSNNSVPPAGSFEKCNGSLNIEVPCNLNATVNISCSGNSETVYAALGIQDQLNCSSNNDTQKHYCYCSAYCNSNATYYILNFKVTDPSLDSKQLIPDLIKNPLCDITEFGCKLWNNISKIYENSTVQCVSETSCIVIVKLQYGLDVCLVSSGLINALQNQTGIQTIGSVSRVAICSWENKPNLDLLQSNLQVSVNLSNSDFCMVKNLDSLLDYCNGEVDLTVLLKDSCTNNPVTALPTSQPSTVTVDTTAITNATTITITSNTSVPSINNTTLLQDNTTAFVTTVGNGTTSNSTTTLNTTASDTTVTATTVNTTVSTISPASAELEAEGLLNLSKNVSALNSTQVEELVNQLDLLLSGPNVSLALGNTSVRIVSNLLDAPAATLSSTSNKIIGIVDKVGLKLVVTGQSETILSSSVALAVKKVDGTNFQQTSFSITDSSSLQIGGVSRFRKSVQATVVPPQGSILLPASLLSNLSLQEQQLVSRTQFNFYQKSTLFQDRTLNPNKTKLISGILGTSVANLSISSLRDKVQITLRNTEPVLANLSVSCVFWDFRLNGGSGGWSPKGCNVLNSTMNVTECECNHLTSFGVLLDISGAGITSRLQSTILTYITYIGCGISAIFLSITLLTYLAFEKLRKDIPSKILIQLCLALLLLNLVFLLDSWLALYPNAMGLCISTAFFLHYFLLASFTWMALEAVHMYFALVKVFNTYISRFMLKLGFAGWGIPLVVVIIVISIDNSKNYGLVSYGKFEDGSTDDFCWLKNSIAFYVAVVAYFCAVFVLNLSMFIVVMVQLCRIKRQNPHNVQHRSGLQDLRSVAGLTVLLGLTWGFAFFAWGPVNLAFMYLFAIFNSLQGFFIFVFHCAVKENVRRQWRIYLCCGKLRLAENSDWSHTATQKTKKSSVNRVGSSSVKSSRSNNSSSAFLVSNSSGTGSERSLGISSPFDDRTIMGQEESSSDVVMNEINHRDRIQRSY